MERSDIRVGDTYALKAANGRAVVRIDEEKWKGDKHTGWVGVDLATNRKVYINSATRLLARVAVEPGDSVSAPQAGEGLDAAGDGEGAPTGSGEAPPVEPGNPEPKGNEGAASTTSKAPKKRRVAPAGTRRNPRPKADGKMSGLDAAAKVLAESDGPMRVEEIISTAKEKGYWESKAGKTPGATVYAAIIREIRGKGADSRFVKTDRGLFAASEAAR